ncbi:MAG: COQ9 family protein [Rickettsiales bacterium]
MAKNLKKTFLKEALNMLPIYGWNAELIINVEDQLGYHNIFTTIKDLVAYHLEQNDLKMLKKLANAKEPEKVRDKIKLALLTKITLNDAAILKETVKFLTKPQNTNLAFKSLANSCDKIWIYAGDKSADFNYYTKRTLLAGIYSATIVYYIKNSEQDTLNEQDLELFISKRIDEILKLGSFKTKIIDETTNLFKKFKPN